MVAEDTASAQPGSKSGRRDKKPTRKAAVEVKPSTGAEMHASTMTVAATNDTITKMTRLYLTPAQYAKLKTGKKVNVFVGPKGDWYIGIEAAYMNLLMHFWGLAKEKLGNGATALYVEGAVKEVVQWIYCYMLGGENDTNCGLTMDDLEIGQLIDLYDHAAFLEYQSLMDRIIGHLRYRFRETLPNINSIQRIDVIIPALKEHVIKIITNVMIQPLVFDYTIYIEYVQEDIAFGVALEQSIKEALRQRVAFSEQHYNKPNPNRHLRASIEYYRKVAASRPTALPPIALHDAVESPVAKEQRRKKPRRLQKARHAADQNESGEAAIPVAKQPAAPNAQAADVPHTDEAPTNGKKKRPKRRRRNPKRKVPRRAAVTDVRGESAIHGNAKKLLYKEKSKTLHICLRCGKQGHIPQDCTMPKDGMKVPVTMATEEGPPTTTAITPTSKKRNRRTPICFTCSEPGHVARNCLTAQDQNNPSATTPQATSTDPATEASLKPARPPPICYNCNEEAHIARNCRYPREFAKKNLYHQEGYSETPPSGPTPGRNRYRRRAQVDRQLDYVRAVEVICSREGITTYDGEVTEDEVTRTGSVVR